MKQHGVPGSLITAEMAADAGREVGAVPGPVTAGPSAGTNELIANGAALIRDGNDVLDRLIGTGLRLPEPLFGPDLTIGELRVLAAVEAGAEQDRRDLCRGRTRCRGELRPVWPGWRLPATSAAL